MIEGYLVVSCSKFDFTSDDGKNIIGLKVTYLEQPESAPNNLGCRTVIVSSQDTSIFDKFRDKEGVTLLPAYFDLFISLAPGAQGKAKPVLKDVKFIKKVTL